MMKMTPLLIPMVILCAAPCALAQRSKSVFASKLSAQELRKDLSRQSDGAILELGRRKDAESVPILRRIAGDSEITVGKVQGISKTHADCKPRDWNCHMNVGLLNTPRASACFAARAALTKMGVADYFGSFLVELSTTNPAWKWEILEDLGYIGDRRAIKYIGPALFDETPLMPPPKPSHVIADGAAGALGDIIPQSFMKIADGSAYIPEWRQWWIAHRSEYGDHSPLPSVSNQSSSAANSSQVSILRNSEIKGNITAGAVAGAADLAFDSVKVQLPVTAGQEITVNVSMILAPQDGPLWWKYRIASASDTTDDIQAVSDAYKFYLTTNLLHAFRLESNRITISDGGVRYQSTDVALSAIVPVVQKKLTNGDKTPALTTRSVDLWKILGQQFFLKGGRVGTGTITSVVLRDAQWVLSITGPNNDSAVVTLDSGYKVVSATLNGKVAYP